MNLEGSRRALERLMVDTCTIVADRSDLDVGVLDPVTLRVGVDPDDATLYAGPVKIAAAARQPGATDAGGVPRTIVDYEATLPLSAPVIPVGAVLTVTAVNEAEGSDPGLLGRDFVVYESPTSTIALVRRLRIRLDEPAVRI